MSRKLVEVPLSWVKGKQTVHTSTDEDLRRSITAKAVKAVNSDREYPSVFVPVIAIEMDDEVHEDDFIEMNVWIIRAGEDVPYEEDEYNEVEFLGTFVHQHEIYYVYTFIASGQ